MSYVAMTHRSAGYIVPASEWNQLIDNDAYFKSIPPVEKLSFLATTVTNPSTIVETTLWTYALAGGRLGTGNLIRIMANGTFKANGGPHTLIMKLYYGANPVTIFSMGVTNGPRQYELTLWLRGNGATNSQTVYSMLRDESNNVYNVTGGAMATDSTAAQNLIIKGLNPNSSTNEYEGLDTLTCEFFSS